MNVKLFVTVSLILVGIFSLHAQHTLKGTIVDAQNEPLAFANVVLMETGKDLPKGAVSDENGNYIFENLPTGTYTLEVSVLGFETKKFEAFELTKDKTINAVLKEESQTLDEVVIKSKRPVIKQTAEKLIVDLEKSEMINTNLQDVMRKIPGVLVTNNGISIAGNRGVRILINGKTTEYMDVETLLRDFPADNISKVEVIEQPGAEYEAAGSGAIINIILKKNVQLGTHGSARAWIGEDEGFEYGTGFSISSYKNKLNWQASVNHSQPTWREDLFLIITVEDEIYDQVTRAPYDPGNFNINANLDYYINDKNTIGIGGRWNNRRSTRVARSTTTISDATNSSVLFSENSFDRDRVDYNINPYYEYKSETERLLIDFNFVDFTNDNINTLSEVAGSTVPFTNRRYIQDGTYNIKTYRLDYSKSFSDNFKLSMGSRFADVETDNDLQSLIANNAGGFDLLENESSQFLIDETIFAVYSKVNANFGKWSFSGGLRYEDSNTEGLSIFMDNGAMREEVQNRPIQKIFPSASLSRKLSEKLGASLSYSYRIQRPSYNSLNSFATFLDPFSAGEGNPNLRPAFTNNYQFNLTYEGQPFFTIGYSDTQNVIFDLIRQDNTTAQIRQQEVNLESNNNWNFRLFAPLSFIDGLEGYTGFIGTYTDFQSETFDVDLDKWNLLWFAQASYELPWDINLETNFTYGTGALEGQIDLDWFVEWDLSLGKKFMNDRLRVNLGLNQILNRGYVGNIDYGNGTASVESNGSRQNIQLRFVYSFGSQFGKKKGRRKLSRDEEERIRDNN
jgi:hypothetical protein